nr:MAG TPA: hypothetical protein [Caudoviricetes sp.]
MSDKKLTDEEIIKTLERCVKRGNRNYDTDIVLDFINRQKETIETLRKCVEQHHIIRKDSKSPLSLLTEEIRAEAYKEFAERLKKETLSDKGYDILQQGTIDNLLKEMGK